MASIKPSVPKGTRDFSPVEMVKRNYIFDTIKSVFRKYGYQQIETPTMENSSTLMGKYGDEGDRLIFKVLESGEFSEKTEAYKKLENWDDVNFIAEYKLTNPGANPNELTPQSWTKITTMWKEIASDFAKEYLNSKRLAKEISEKALRYDLTVPFARYVVQH